MYSKRCCNYNDKDISLDNTRYTVPLWLSINVSISHICSVARKVTNRRARDYTSSNDWMEQYAVAAAAVEIGKQKHMSFMMTHS